MTNIPRIFLAIMLMFVSAFSIFGYLATFEPGVPNAVDWRTGYIAAGGVSLVVALWVCWIAYSRLRAR